MNIFDEIVNDEMDMVEYETEQYFEDLNRSFDSRTEEQAISELLRSADVLEYVF
jgi:hypothetical protein